MSKSTNHFEEISLSVHIARYLETVRWQCSGVIHPTWFLFWNPRGKAQIICGEEKFEVTDEHAFMIPGHTTISAYSDGEFSHLYTHFSAGSPFDRVKNQIYVLDSGPARKFYAEHLKKSGIEQNLRWRILIMEYLAMLPEKAFGGTPVLDERIRKALEAAEKHRFSKLSNEFLAHAAGMSVNNFCRCFRKELQISPQRYFVSMRLNAARDMLENSGSQIPEVALQCGFADRYQFSKSFKEYFGIAPGAFRRKSGGGSGR